VGASTAAWSPVDLWRELRLGGVALVGDARDAAASSVAQ
jgi:hypothetical protein